MKKRDKMEDESRIREKEFCKGMLTASRKIKEANDKKEIIRKIQKNAEAEMDSLEDYENEERFNEIMELARRAEE